MSNGEQQSTRTGAHDDEPRPPASSALGQGLQEQIGQALGPAMTQLRDQITATVQRELARNGQRHESNRAAPVMDRRQDDDDRPSRSEAEQDIGSSGETEPTRESEPTSARAGEGSSSESSEREEPDAGPGPELSQMLQEQIGQALEPAMAEFREQMSASVRRELDQVRNQDREQRQPDQARDQDREQPQPDQARNQDREQPQSESRQPSGREQAGQDRPSQQRADGSGDGGRSGDEGQSKGGESGGQRGLQSLLPLLGKPLLEALPAILERQGEHWLRSRLDQGLDVLFSDWVRTIIRHEVKHMLELLRRVALQIIPDRDTREDLTARADRVIEALARDGVDELFTDSRRDDLKEHGRQAIHALFEPDLRAALREIQAVLRLLVDGLLAVLRQCWEQVLELLVRVVIAVLQARLSTVLKGAFTSLATTSGRQAGSDDKNTQPALDEKRSEARETGDEAAEQPSSRVPSEERQSHQDDDDESEERSSEQSDRQPVRPPTGRSSSTRPPSARQSSGRSFSDRAPSGRPPRSVSR